MSVHVSVRSYRRPDQPQPVYPRVVDAIVAKWIPAFAAALGCVRTGDRADLDLRLAEWDAEFTWVQPVVDRTVRTWSPVFATELGCVRTGDRADLDVRPEWAPAFTWVRPVVDRLVASWSPGINGPEGDCTRGGVRLDVRDCAPPPAWMFSSLPVTSTTAQQWPALLQALGISYRSGDRPCLDVRRLDVPLFTWPQPVVDGIVARWSPNWTDGRLGERSPDGPRLDPRRYEWAPPFTWVAPVVDAQVSVWGPALRTGALSTRTADVPDLDVRTQEWQPSLAWIFKNLPGTVTQAQLWPAILQGLGLLYRMGDRPALDVRSTPFAPGDGWSTRVVDATVTTWGPAVRMGALSDRTRDRGLLDVRQPEWIPSLAWILSSLPPSLTPAQIWPALLEALGLSYRSDARPGGDVRRVDPPAFSWPQPVVDRTVTTWGPVFAAELKGERSAARPPMEGRRYEWSPEQGWLKSLIEVAIRAWAPIWRHQLTTFRTVVRGVLDPRLESIFAKLFPFTVPTTIVDVVEIRGSFVPSRDCLGTYVPSATLLGSYVPSPLALVSVVPVVTILGSYVPAQEIPGSVRQPTHKHGFQATGFGHGFDV